MIVLNFNVLIVLVVFNTMIVNNEELFSLGVDVIVHLGCIKNIEVWTRGIYCIRVTLLIDKNEVQSAIYTMLFITHKHTNNM